LCLILGDEVEEAMQRTSSQQQQQQGDSVETFQQKYLSSGKFNFNLVSSQMSSLHIPHRPDSYIRLRDLEEHGQDTSEVGSLPPAQPAKDSGRRMERSHVQHRGVKADWAAKITGHCSGEQG